MTLVRLEKGEQSPRFNTLDAIAKALGRRVPELLVEPESLLQPIRWVHWDIHWQRAGDGSVTDHI